MKLCLSAENHMFLIVLRDTLLHSETTEKSPVKADDRQQTARLSLEFTSPERQ